MTLLEFLVQQQTRYTTEVISNLRGDGRSYYKSKGKVFMCTDLIDLLSDETLSMEVETRSKALGKYKKKTEVKECRCGCPFMKGE